MDQLIPSITVKLNNTFQNEQLREKYADSERNKI